MQKNHKLDKKVICILRLLFLKALCKHIDLLNFSPCCQGFSTFPPIVGDMMKIDDILYEVTY